MSLLLSNLVDVWKSSTHDVPDSPLLCRFCEKVEIQRRVCDEYQYELVNTDAVNRPIMHYFGDLHLLMSFSNAPSISECFSNFVVSLLLRDYLDLSA